MHAIAIATWDELEPHTPTYALVANVDLVIVRYPNDADAGEDAVSVLFGRCLHRGALMSDGHVDGHNLICGVHGWDDRSDTGVSEYDNAEKLHKFTAWLDTDGDGVRRVSVDRDEVAGPGAVAMASR